MCVFHKFCIVCFCAYVLSNGVSGDVKKNGDDKYIASGKENATKTSRGQNVKDVIHVHEHNGSNITSDSFREGLFFAQKIFEKFGDDTHISKTNLEKLFKELKLFASVSENDSHPHDHEEHAEEQGDHEHEAGHLGHQEHDNTHSGRLEQDPNAHEQQDKDHGHSTNDGHEHKQESREQVQHHEDHDHDHTDEHGKEHHEHDGGVHDHTVHEHQDSEHDHKHPTEASHEHLNGSSEVSEHHGSDSSVKDTEHSEYHEHPHEHHNEHENNENQRSTGKSDSDEHSESHVSKRSVANVLSNTKVKRSFNHSDISHSRCLSAEEIWKIYHFDMEAELTVEQFLHLSPAIIFQLDNPECRQQKSGHSHGTVTKTVAFSDISPQVWGYSTAAVIIISLVGLLGVAVIPIMQKVFYNHLLQFLVALAVGTLTGDALLHLLPHAIIGESHDHSSDHKTHEGPNLHHSAILKGLCALFGLFFFFLIERIMTIVTDMKRKRKQKKRRSLPPRQTTDCKDDKNRSIAMKLSAYDESDYQSCEEMVMVVHPNKSLKGFADETHHKVFHTSHDGCRPEEVNNSGSHSIPDADEEEGMLGSLPHSHSGHSHHAHCEMMTNSVASVAWMVILGDGIHNFSDGLAIGAAFSSNIPGGISTSIAVFCHELPHEIGDFAVLLRAGMSVKQAIVYNILSSVLCFVGMLIGVAIGNIEAASQWIFACVAGMFIYIATVDMLPEMTSVDTKKGEHPFCHLFLQCLGMIVGAGIMLIIAFYEEELLTSLDYV